VPQIEDAVDLYRVNKAFERPLGPLTADRIGDDSPCPLGALTDTGADLGMIEEARDRLRSLARFRNSHQAPEVSDILVAHPTLSRFAQTFTDLGSLGQYQSRNSATWISADRLGSTKSEIVMTDRLNTASSNPRAFPTASFPCRAWGAGTLRLLRLVVPDSPCGASRSIFSRNVALPRRS